MPEPGPPSESGSQMPFMHRLATFESSLVLGGIALFLLFLFQLQAFLSPPLVAAAAVILLWPVRRHRTVRALLLAGGFLLMIWFLDRLSTVLLPFAIIYLMAFLFDPVVGHLRDRYGIPRTASSLAITVLVLGLLVMFILLLVPSIFNELESLASRILLSIGDMREWLITAPFLDRLEEAGIIDKHEVAAQMTTFVQEQSMRITESIPAAVDRLLRSIGSLLGLIMILAITPVVLFYTLRDYPHIKRRLFELFPTFGGEREYLMKAGTVVGNYMRGQLTISLIATINISVGLLLFNVPFALLIGLMAGVLNLIPNIGAVILNVIASLIAIVFGDPWLTTLIIVQVIVLGQQLLEAIVLTPKILSAHVGLHPVLIVLSLFVFGYLLGLFGLFIAVPATALIMALYKTYRDRMTLDLAEGHAGKTVARAPRFRMPE
jgi:predicted PurR-regulated permease PerM